MYQRSRVLCLSPQQVPIGAKCARLRVTLVSEGYEHAGCRGYLLITAHSPSGTLTTLAWLVGFLTTCSCSQSRIGGYWLTGAIIKCQCTSPFSGDWVEVKWKKPVGGQGRETSYARHSAMSESCRPCLVWEMGDAGQRWVQGGCSALIGIAYSLMLVRKSYGFFVLCFF